MPIYLGSAKKDFPHARVYLGDKLKYKRSVEFEFSSCPFPTSWTEVTEYEKYEATNDFGKWIITSSINHMSWIAPKAFDGKDSTEWRCNNLPRTIGIECPVAIKPAQVHIVHGKQGGGTLQGFNVITGVWEDLLTLSKTTSSTVTVDTEILTENYYSQFQIVFTRYSSSSSTVYLYEFQIKSGFYKPLK